MGRETTPELVQRISAGIKSRRYIKTVESGIMFVYDEERGTYIPQAEEVLYQEIEAELQERSTNYVVREIVDKIKRTTPASVDDFDSDDTVVHVGNGLLDLSTMALTPHDRTFLSMRKVSANYDPDAECPLFRRFLEDTMEKPDQVVVQQLLGYLLLNNYRYRHAFVFVGPTHTGKTTLMNTITAFLGAENTVSIPLQSLCDVSSYDTHDLVRVMANVHDDLEKEDVKRFGRLKQLTGDSRVRAREIYGKPFDFWSKAKQVFASNELPSAPHADDAYYGRWVIVPMLRQFTEGTTADDRMGDRLSSPSELSGILNFALDGLKLLELFRGFAYPTDAVAQRTRYLAYSGDPIARFVSECVVFASGEIAPKPTVYDFYARFCELIGVAVADDTSFFMRLSGYLDSRVEDCRPTEVNRQRAYRGITVVLPKTTRPNSRFQYTAVSIHPRDFVND